MPKVVAHKVACLGHDKNRERAATIVFSISYYVICSNEIFLVFNESKTD